MVLENDALWLRQSDILFFLRSSNNNNKKNQWIK